MNAKDTRSSLARAIGLGSAKHGTGHWWAQRTSAVALVPLALWFIASIIAHSNNEHAELIAWLKSPVASISMILLLGASFYHAALGLQVVIEDYLHTGMKYVAVIGVQVICLTLASTGIMAVLSIAFGH